jgi:hypothetical protein
MESFFIGSHDIISHGRIYRLGDCQRYASNSGFIVEENYLSFLIVNHDIQLRNGEGDGGSVAQAMLSGIDRGDYSPFFEKGLWGKEAHG